MSRYGRSSWDRRQRKRLGQKLDVILITFTIFMLGGFIGYFMGVTST